MQVKKETFHEEMHTYKGRVLAMIDDEIYIIVPFTECSDLIGVSKEKFEKETRDRYFEFIIKNNFETEQKFRNPLRRVFVDILCSDLYIRYDGKECVPLPEITAVQKEFQ